MSEYWVSKKKYFCRYCEIYIADDVPSRQQHENGLRHKGNTERFIRNLYKTGEKRKKELDDEKREMALVERAAQAAFAQDIGAGLAKPSESSSSSRTPAAAAPRKPSAKPVNPYANYSSPASLGYQDPDKEKLAAAAELRRTQGVAGQWELVTTTPQPAEAEASCSTSPVPDTGASLKRESETVIEDEEDGRSFKLRKKTLGGGLGDIYDPGIIPIKLKKKDEPVDAANTVSAPSIPPGERSKPAGAPKWTKVQWDTPIDDDVKQEPEPGDGKLSADQADTRSTLPTEGIPFTAEEQPSDPDTKEAILSRAQTSSSTATIPESAGNMFKKRKIPSGTARGKRQM